MENEITYHTDTVTVGEKINYNGKSWCVVAWSDLQDKMKLYLSEIGGKGFITIYTNIPKYIGLRKYSDVRRERPQPKPTTHYPTVAEIREREKLNNKKSKPTGKNKTPKQKRGEQLKLKL